MSTDRPDDATPPTQPRRAWSGGMPHGARVALRASIAALSLLIIVASGMAWATFEQFKASVPHGDPVAALRKGETDPDGADQDILLIGDDTRAGASPAELRALHAGHDTTTVNADTMMVLHLPADGSRPTIVSFPRDAWVTIPGHGKGKLNSAYPDAYNTAKSAHRSETQAQSAGIRSTIATLHELTGLHIDHYVQVDLLGFYRISEAIGGVTVCLNAAQNASTDADAFRRGYSGINLPKGVSVIKGEQALAFVRQRHGLPHGDLDRIKRQQYFLRAAFDRITSAGVLLNPFKMRDLLDAVGHSLLTDPSLDLLSLARQFQSLTSGKINTATLPNNGTQLIYPDGVETSVVKVDTAAIPGFVHQLTGKVSTSLKTVVAAPPSRVIVDVLNGTDTPRLASRNAAALTHRHFRVNAVDSTGLTATTTIEYPAAKAAGAKALRAVVPRAKLIETTGVSRVTLVLGANGVEVGAPGRVAAGAHTPSRVAVTSSAANGLGCID